MNDNFNEDDINEFNGKELDAVGIELFRYLKNTYKYEFHDSYRIIKILYVKLLVFSYSRIKDEKFIDGELITLKMMFNNYMKRADKNERQH